VFSSLSGIGKEAQTFVKKFATLLSEKHKERYSHVIGLLKAQIAFALCTDYYITYGRRTAGYV
jgi:hypothetical protein